MGTRGRPKKEAACRTCKIRRVKCDETKPECRRCTTTGRKCDGYTSLGSSVIPFEIFSSSQELRSFKYFCDKTSLEISSHYDETFWQSLVLQLSHTNSGLGHLVIAIGSLHETLKDTTWTPGGLTLDQSQVSFSLQQCNKAISILTQQKLEDSNIGVLMTSCILFMAFEMLQNRLDTALHQFKIGMRLLRQWRQKSTRAPTSLSERDLIENHLGPILDRFSESCGLIPVAGREKALPGSPSATSSDNEKPFSMPRVFLSLGQARTSLHSALDYVFQSLAKTTENDLQAGSDFYEEFSPALSEWHAQFRQFVDTLKDDIGSSNKRRICLLEIQHCVSSISFAASIFKNETIYDQYLDEFQRIVQLCMDVVQIESGTPVPSQAPFMSFSFDVCILMPLYFTATKCRDPKTRRQALFVLQAYPRREGIWLSWITRLVAEQIMQIEEGDLDVKSSDDVLTNSRIRLLHMHYDPQPVGMEEQKTIYQPVIQLSWAKSETSSTNSKAAVDHRSIQLAPTTDDRPGLKPYWVIMPSGLEISHWKMIIGKKMFEEPEEPVGTVKDLEDSGDPQ